LVKLNPAFNSGVKVEYLWCSNTSFSQLGNISVLNLDCLMIAPYDNQPFPGIEKAIRAAGLGLKPNE